MGSSASKKKKQNIIVSDGEKKKINQLDANATDVQQVDPSPKSNNEIMNNSQTPQIQYQVKNNLNGKEFSKKEKTQDRVTINAENKNRNQPSVIESDTVPVYINGGLDQIYTTQKSLKLIPNNNPLNAAAPSAGVTGQNLGRQSDLKANKHLNGKLQEQEPIESAAPLPTLSVKINSREKSATIHAPQNIIQDKSSSLLKNTDTPTRTKNLSFQQPPPEQPKNQHKIEVASQSDLNIVKFDLLKLVQEMQMQKQGDVSFDRRHTNGFQEGSVTDLGGGGNFMEGSMIDFFSMHQQPKYITEKKVLELQETLRCDTDLLSLVKQNLNSGSIGKSVGFSSPTILKKRSLIMGVPLIRKCSSSNIKENNPNETSFEMGDDYNLSPISRKQSMQYTLNTFGDFGLTSLAQLDKNGEQMSSYQNSNTDSSISDTNTQVQSSTNVVPNEKSEKNIYTIPTQQSEKQHTEESSKEIRLMVKRQSSVRFMLPTTNLEKIREDEKEEDLNTKTSHNEFSPEKKRVQYVREKKLSTNSSGILKNILQEKGEDTSSILSKDYDDSKDDHHKNHCLIKDYLETENDNSEETSTIPKINLRLTEYSNSNLMTINTKDLKDMQRSSIFFSQNPKLLDIIEKGQADNLIEEQASPNKNDNDSQRSPRSAQDRKNTYLAKRQSAYIKIEDLQKSPKMLERAAELSNNLLQPRFYHSNTLQQPQTPTAHNTSNISNASYITYFNKNPDQSVIETSYVKKEVDDEGKKRINSYTLLYELGRGGFGKVKLASSEFPTDNGVITKYFAIKVSNKQKLKRRLISMKVNAYTLLEREVAIMKKIDHPHLVKLYEVIDDPDDDKIYMVMEYMQKGSIMSNTYWKKELLENDPPLYEKIFGGEEDKKLKNKQKLEMLPKTVSEEKCRKYFQQFTLAIDYMHNFAQVIHRDIKPENILIDENDNLKIADFGVSHIMESSDDSEIKDNAGTKAFTAPEGWSRNFKGKPLDMWATGITLYNMAIGELPFFSKDPNKLKNSIINDEVKIPEDINPLLADLIKKLLMKNPDQRITAQEMLQHPWLTLNGTILLQNSENSAKNIQISMEDLQGAFTKKIQLSTLIRVKFRLNRQLTRARSFLHANASGFGLGLDNSINQERLNTDPNNQSPLKTPTKQPNILK